MSKYLLSYDEADVAAGLLNVDSEGVLKGMHLPESVNGVGSVGYDIVVKLDGGASLADIGTVEKTNIELVTCDWDVIREKVTKHERLNAYIGMWGDPADTDYYENHFPIIGYDFDSSSGEIAITFFGITESSMSEFMLKYCRLNISENMGVSDFKTYEVAEFVFP